MTKFGLGALLFLLMAFCAYGQSDSLRYGEIKDAQFIIEKDKRIDIPPFNRTYSAYQVFVPTLTPLQLRETRIPVTIEPPLLNQSFKIPSVENDGSPIPNNNFVQLLGGNYNIFEGLVTRKGEVGKFDYFSGLQYDRVGSGPITYTNSGEDLTHLSGVLFQTETKTQSKLFIDYSSKGFYFYGINKRDIALARQSEDYFTAGQSLNRFSSTLDYSRQLTDRSNFQVKPTWNLLSMKDKANGRYNREYVISLNADYRLRFNNSNSIQIGLNTALSRYSSGVVSKRNYIWTTPSYHHGGERFKFKGGLSFLVVNDQKDRNLLFGPDVEMTYSLTEDWYLTTSWKPSIEFNSLFEMSQSLPWLQDSLDLATSVKMTNIRSGIGGKITDKLMFELNLGYSTTNNKLLFINSIQDTSRFSSLFPRGLVTEFDLVAFLTYSVNDALSIDGTLTLNKYQVSGDLEAWHLPTETIQIVTTYSPVERLRIFNEILLYSGIKTLDYQTNSVIDLNTIVDIAMGMQYKLTNGLSLYASGFNLLNRSYERYMNYTVLGANFKAGLSIRF